MITPDQKNPIVIISGEGEGPGTVEIYTGKISIRTINARLTKERNGGDRWAKAVQYAGENDYGHFGVSLDDGDDAAWDAEWLTDA